MDIQKALLRQAKRADELRVLTDKVDDTVLEARRWLLDFASHDFFRAQVTEEDMKLIRIQMKETIAAMKRIADDLSQMNAHLLEIARRS